jgi:hypothetical protein
MSRIRLLIGQILVIFRDGDRRSLAGGAAVGDRGHYLFPQFAVRRARHNFCRDIDVAAAADAKPRGSEGFKSRIAKHLLKHVVDRRGSMAADAGVQDRLQGILKDIRIGKRHVTVLGETQLRLIQNLLCALALPAYSNVAVRKEAARRFKRFAQEIGIALTKTGIGL